jgi:hypothetical protein
MTLYSEVHNIGVIHGKNCTGKDIGKGSTPIVILLLTCAQCNITSWSMWETQDTYYVSKNIH